MLLNEQVDVSQNFNDPQATYFMTDKLTHWDQETRCGRIGWNRFIRKVRFAFNQAGSVFEESTSWSFPPDYEEKPELELRIDPVSHKTVRIRIQLKKSNWDRDSLGMLIPPFDTNFSDNLLSEYSLVNKEDRLEMTTGRYTLRIDKDPFRIYFYDSGRKLLTSTVHTHTLKGLRNSDSPQFSIVENPDNWSRTGCFAFEMRPDEAFFGTGESFTRLNKRGQKAVLWTQDTNGCQRNAYYKPVPFFISSEGWGAFLHTTSPAVFDFGATFDSTLALYNEDSEIDLFLFAGSPAEILTEYTSLTGRAPLPPLWSFGLWMSRISYSSEKEVREVAARLRTEKIPCDVIHIDTGWFEKEWRCDYRFSDSRFDDPAGMLKDLKADGFRISLWQLPYFTPQNPLYTEALSKGYVVTDGHGGVPSEDAIIDFTNPKAVAWYKKLLTGLFEIGVAAIKADFGEAAPINGTYKSNLPGLLEHNRYPLLYNRAVFEATCEACKNIHPQSEKEAEKENYISRGIIWARSAWAGSQRYPVHWGGDSENTDNAMAATLRAGISLGLSGFSFWSHDIGGFVKSSPEELYRRWLPFGMLTSHSRCHGAPPKEPWAYSPDFTNFFRNVVTLKYMLMPYIMAQATICSNLGHPMLRPLLFEYPQDRTSWYIEDQYLFGSSMLAAPLFQSEQSSRTLYLPPGQWVNFQTGVQYEGGGWKTCEGGELNMPLFVKSGTIIPMAVDATCTDAIDWEHIDYKAFGNEEEYYGSTWSPSTGLQNLIGRPDKDGTLQISTAINEL